MGESGYGGVSHGGPRDIGIMEIGADLSIRMSGAGVSYRECWEVPGVGSSGVRVSVFIGESGCGVTQSLGGRVFAKDVE